MTVRAKRWVFRRLGAWPGVLWRLRRPQSLPAASVAGPTVIAVSLRKHTLDLYEHGLLTRSYHVGIGGWRARTPPGHFRVTAKIRNPAWSVPDVPERYGDLAGKIVQAGDPAHRLGPRWLQLTAGLGIHGKRPGRLGIGSTNGCVALACPDLLELYDRVEIGAPVVIY